MSDFIIKGTEDTPTVEFKLNEGSLTIKGRSIAENPSAFFEPLLACLSTYEKLPAKILMLIFRWSILIQALLNLFYKY